VQKQRTIWPEEASVINALYNSCEFPGIESKIPELCSTITGHRSRELGSRYLHAGCRYVRKRMVQNPRNDSTRLR